LDDTQPIFVSGARGVRAGLPMPACPRFMAYTPMARPMREQKITLGEMRASGPSRLLIYCADYRCSHSVVIDADRWPDHVRLSDLEPKFTCQACGRRGAGRPVRALNKPTPVNPP
jgi:hypothetical protein